MDFSDSRENLKKDFLGRIFLYYPYRFFIYWILVLFIFLIITIPLIIISLLLKTLKSIFGKSINDFSIAMVIPYLKRIGGYEKQAVSLCRYLKGNGIKVLIVTNTLLEEIGTLKDEFDIYRTSFFPEFPRHPVTSLNSMLLFSIKNFSKFNLFHSHAFCWLSGSATIAGKIFEKKSIIKVASEGDVEHLATSIHLDDKIYFSGLKMADGFFAISSNIGKELLRFGINEKKIFLTSNAVDIEYFKPVNAEEKIKLRKKLGIEKDFIVTYAGRLDKNKGVDTIVFAWERILKEKENPLLLILGDGPEKKNLIETVSIMNLGERVLFKGFVDDVASYLKASDVFIFPSLREGNPNAVLEAMSCGIPVIANSIEGIRDIISDGVDGILVYSKSPDEFAKKVLSLLRNSSLRINIGKEARGKILTRFSFKATVDRYLELYKELISQ